MKPQHPPRYTKIMWGAFLVVAVIGATWLTHQAAALFESVVENGQPGYLSLRSNPGNPHWNNVEPGQTITWDIETRLDDAERAHLAVEIHAEGTIVEDGLRLRLRECPTPFTHDACPHGGSHIVTDAALRDIATPTAAEVFTLPTLTIDHPHYYRLDLTRPKAQTPPEPQPQSGSDSTQTEARMRPAPLRPNLLNPHHQHDPPEPVTFPSPEPPSPPSPC